MTFETLTTILTIENLNSWQSLWPDNLLWHWTAFAILAMFIRTISNLLLNKYFVHTHILFLDKVIWDEGSTGGSYLRICSTTLSLAAPSPTKSTAGAVLIRTHRTKILHLDFDRPSRRPNFSFLNCAFTLSQNCWECFWQDRSLFHNGHISACHLRRGFLQKFPC